MAAPSPSALVAGMRPSELGYWATLWLIDPWHERRKDERTAAVGLAIAQGTLKKGSGAPWRLEDFMPYPELQEAPADHVALSRSIRYAMGGPPVHEAPPLTQ